MGNSDVYRREYLIHAAGDGGTVGIKEVRLMEIPRANFAALDPDVHNQASIPIG